MVGNRSPRFFSSARATALLTRGSIPGIISVKGGTGLARIAVIRCAPVFGAHGSEPTSASHVITAHEN